jgi:hypothetical protein
MALLLVQFAPGNPSEILVTSADSQIRVFNGITVLQKFKGTPDNGGEPRPSLAQLSQTRTPRTTTTQREPVLLPRRVQEHEQPDLGVLHRRRPLRGVRQRGLPRLPVAPRRVRGRRRGRDGGHRRQGQDVAHQPLLRVLLLQGRVRGRAVARRAAAAAPAERVQRPRRWQCAAPAQVRADDALLRWRWARGGPVVAPGAVGVGDGGGDGEPRRGDQGVPELWAASRRQRPGQSLLPLVRPLECP